MDDLKGDALEAKQLMELDYEKQAAQAAAGQEEGGRQRRKNQQQGQAKTLHHNRTFPYSVRRR